MSKLLTLVATDMCDVAKLFGSTLTFVTDAIFDCELTKIFMRCMLTVLLE